MDEQWPTKAETKPRAYNFDSADVSEFALFFCQHRNTQYVDRLTVDLLHLVLEQPRCSVLWIIMDAEQVAQVS